MDGEEAYPLRSGSDACVCPHHPCRDIATGEILPDEIHWLKFSGVSWTKDGKGFFYSKYPAPSSKGKEDGAGTEVDANAGQKVRE